MFSCANEALRIRRSDGRYSKQPGQNDKQVETAVESILELDEVTMGIFWKNRTHGKLQRTSSSDCPAGIDRAKLFQLPAEAGSPSVFVVGSQSAH